MLKKSGKIHELKLIPIEKVNRESSVIRRNAARFALFKAYTKQPA